LHGDQGISRAVFTTTSAEEGTGTGRVKNPVLETDMNFAEMCMAAVIGALLVGAAYAYFSLEGGSDHEDMG
jgi:hypothetical protein